MNYYRPEKLSELKNIIAEEKTKIYFLAGATDLYVQMKEELLVRPNVFIDITGIKELSKISETSSEIKIGATVTFSEIIENKIVNKYAPLLVAAAKEIGSPLIRNRATIGGNIANASPAGDSIPPLYALDAKLSIYSKNKKSLLCPITEFFVGPKKNILENGELITHIIIPKNKFNFFSFQKLGPRKALAISKISLALAGECSRKKIEQIKISAGAVGPTVIRCSRTEDYLKGKILDESILKTACDIIKTEISPIDDFRSTALYRQEMTAYLLKTALKKLF